MPLALPLALITFLGGFVQIMKRQVQLHPAVILVVVTAGTLIAGIAGAFVSVPVAAVTWRIIDTVQRHREPAAAPPGQPAAA